MPSTPSERPDVPVIDIVDFLDEFPEFAKPPSRPSPDVRDDVPFGSALLVAFHVDHAGKPMKPKKVIKRIGRVRQALLGVLAERLESEPDADVPDDRVPQVLFRSRIDEVRSALADNPLVASLTLVDGSPAAPSRVVPPGGKRAERGEHPFGLPASSFAAMLANDALGDDDEPIVIDESDED